MKEIELQLVPQPGAKPEFLAKLAVVDPSPVVSKVWTQMVDDSLKQQKNINSKSDTKSPSTPILVLEGYTRDGWAWKPTSGNVYQTVIVQSTDGRHKLPGFVKHLKDRQKSAYGRFGNSGVCVVSYIQSKAVAVAAAASTAGGDGNGNNKGDRMECRIALDCTLIPNCPLKPRATAAAVASAGPTPAAAAPSRSPAEVAAAVAASAASGGAAAASKQRKQGGLLGKLVVAQHRTNQHVISATARPASTAAKATTAAVASNGHTTGEKGAAAAAAAITATMPAAAPTRTAQAVLVEFRQAMEQKMLDFDESDEQVLRVELNLAEHTAGLSDIDKSTKVTMEILKYMVYEASEEVNDEWIAHKEPSEFLDEVVICVYKPGAAPPEVLEEINKGELPEEVLGQQRALAEEQMRKVNQAERHKAKTLETVAHQYDGDNDDDNDAFLAGGAAALGTKKRDRRSVEEYELEKKRGRPG